MNKYQLFFIVCLVSGCATKPNYIYEECPIGDLPNRPSIAIKSLKKTSRPDETIKAYIQTVHDLDADDNIIRLKLEACK